MAVTTNLRNGTLEIRAADAVANDIVIVGTGIAGEIVVTGRNGTEVNGTPNGSTTISGVTGGLDVNLATAPAHTVSLDNLYLAGFISLELDSPSNVIHVGANAPVSSGRYMQVSFNGNGNNVLRMENANVFVGSSLLIGDRSGSGNELIKLIGASARGYTGIATYDGNDTVLLSNFTSYGHIQLTCEAGTKSLAVLSSSTADYLSVFTRSASQATVYLDTCYAEQYIDVNGNAHVVPLPDADGPVRLSVFRCQTPQLVIRTGAASDHIDLYGNYLTGPPYSFDVRYRPPQTLYVNSRAGNDFVELRYNAVLDDVFAGLGAGDDTMTLTGNLIRNAAYLDGDAADYPAQTIAVNRLNLFGNQFGAFAGLNFL